MPEILAPAGNFDMLKAAVTNGADAVYLGLDKYSARAKAANFCGEELKKAIDYAHLYGVKVYVAVNTVIKDEEMEEALSNAENALNMNADAIIVQDLGFARLLRERRPTAILHASTQMGLHNLEGAIVAKKLGFSRIILSRETLIEDIIKIKKNVDIEIECFVQGALCISFSGNCYFSSMASGYSGNRGKCMQLCRKEYSGSIGGKKFKGYLLSAKDLMLAGKISELVKAGVDCFKIEGRLRRPEYVAEAVRVYKKAIGGKFENSDLVSLKKVFNRGDYTEGHMFCGTEKVLDTKICAHKGAFFGKVVKVKGNVATISKPLVGGDGVKFLRDGYEVGSASIKRSGCETGFAGNVRAGDEVYITTDAEFNRAVMSRKRKLPVGIRMDFDNLEATLYYNGVVLTEKIDAQPALNAPVTEKEIVECFNKSEYFYVSEAAVTGKPSFIRMAQLNELRRTLYDRLIRKILENYNNNMLKFTGSALSMSDIICKKLELSPDETIFQVERPEQITDEMSTVAINPTDYSTENLRRFEPYLNRALLSLPFVARGKDIDVLKETVKLPFKGFIVNNLYGLELVATRPVMLGYGMNIINDVLDLPKIYSFEADKVKENGYVYSQGNVPLMTFCHCEKKELSYGCANCNGYDITLTYDNRNFKMRRYKIFYCYSQLMNCADLDVGRAKRKFIDFSYERAGSTTKGNYGRGLK